MLIKVNLFLDFKACSPTGERAFALELPAGGTVAHLLGQLGIPVEREKVILVNGSSSPADQALAEGDTVSVFPPVDGG